MAGGAFFSSHTRKRAHEKIVVPTTPETESRRRFSRRHRAQATIKGKHTRRRNQRPLETTPSLSGGGALLPETPSIQDALDSIALEQTCKHTGNARRRRHDTPTMQSHARLGHADRNQWPRQAHALRGGAQLESCPEGNHSILPQHRSPTNQTQTGRTRVLKLSGRKDLESREHTEAHDARQSLRSHMHHLDRATRSVGAPTRQEKEAT